MTDLAATSATSATHEPRSLVRKTADRFGVDPDKLLATLKATAFRQRDNKPITNEQMAALLVVADQYGLNPFTKEIFAFEDKGAIIPVVSVDGWLRIINDHSQLDGLEFRYAEQMLHLDGAKECPAWCEIIINRSDRSKPIVVREYLDECYVAPRGQNKIAGPWQSHTKRMLRHKTLIQGSRIAFGFSGIYDEDEARRIIDGESRVIHHSTTNDAAASMAERIIAARQGQVAEVIDVESTEVAEERPLQFDPDTGEVLPPELQS